MGRTGSFWRKSCCWQFTIGDGTAGEVSTKEYREQRGGGCRGKNARDVNTGGYSV